MTGFGLFLVSRRQAYAKYSTFSKTETKTLNFHFFCLLPTHSIAFLCTLTAPVCSLPELPLISDSLYSSFHMVYWRCWSACRCNAELTEHDDQSRRDHHANEASITEVIATTVKDTRAPEKCIKSKPTKMCQSVHTKTIVKCMSRPPNCSVQQN